MLLYGIVYLAVYLDWPITSLKTFKVTWSNENMFQAEFEISTLGDPNYILVVKINRDKKLGIPYINQVCKCFVLSFKMQKLYEVNIPNPVGLKLRKHVKTLIAMQHRKLDKLPYKKLRL